MTVDKNVPREPRTELHAGEIAMAFEREQHRREDLARRVAALEEELAGLVRTFGTALDRQLDELRAQIAEQNRDQ